MRPLAEGEPVILVDRAGNRHLIRLRAGARLHTNVGVVPHDALLEQPEGTIVRSSSGTPLTVWRPRLADYVLDMPRHTAIVYPKDAAIMLMWADVFPGATVLEAGIGSGSLTLMLLRAVGREGRVISYESRPEFIQMALANIRGLLGEPNNLLIRERDIREGIVDKEIDRILLDIPEPWVVIREIVQSLVPGGILATYLPSIVQVQQTVETLDESGWFEPPEVLEVLYRPWHVRGQAVRPVQQMVAHTGFLTVARRRATAWPRRRAAESDAEAPETEADDAVSPN